MFSQFLVLVLSIGLIWTTPNNEGIKSVANPCPHSWVQATWVDMGCLKFNFAAAITWTEANAYCQKDENASLVEIQNAEQYEFLVMQIEVVDSQEAKHHWWTAATDEGREGQWFWIPSLTPVGEFLWTHSGEPNGATEYNCMILAHSWNYEASDIECSGAFYPICQKQV